MPTSAQMQAYWMPFTANRDYKQAPRIVASAKGMYYYDEQGRAILDGTAGLWCVPAGHSHPKIVEAVQQAIATLDYAPAFQMGHPTAFEFAEQLIEYSGHKFGQVFYTNSGSEAVDTAMKMVLAYHRARGDLARCGAAAGGAHSKAEGDVFGHAHVAEQRVVLEHEAHAASGGRERGDILAVEGDDAAVGRVQPGDLAQQRGLARAGGAEQGDEFAGRRVERDVVERDEVAVGLAEVADGNAHGRCGSGEW